MLVTVNREKTCLRHGKGWVESHALLHYRIPAIKSHFSCVLYTDYFCQCDVYQVVGFAKNPKIKTVHSKKMLAVSSNFLDNILCRKMHYP